MAEDDEFKKLMKKTQGDLQNAMEEGMAKRRTLKLTGEEVAKVLDMSDDEVTQLITEKGFDFDKHYINVQVMNRPSEGYMKSPQDLRYWLKRGSLN